MCGKDLTKPFQLQYRGPVKLLQASLGLRKDVEGSFNHCGGPVMLVQACLNAGKV